MTQEMTAGSHNHGPCAECDCQEERLKNNALNHEQQLAALTEEGEWMLHHMRHTAGCAGRIPTPWGAFYATASCNCPARALLDSAAGG